MAAEPAGAAGPKEDAFDQFPAPPNFYKLYEAGPGAGPAPPAPVQGVIHALGEAFDPVGASRCCSKSQSCTRVLQAADHQKVVADDSNEAASSELATVRQLHCLDGLDCT